MSVGHEVSAWKSSVVQEPPSASPSLLQDTPAPQVSFSPTPIIVRFLAASRESYAGSCFIEHCARPTSSARATRS